MQCQLCLHQSLSIGTSSYYHTAVIILDSTGEDLTGRGRCLIRQDHDGILLASACSVSIDIRTWESLALRINNQPSFGHELVDHVDRRLHVTTGISTQIHHEGMALRLLQLGDSRNKLIIGVATKLAHLDITDALRHLIRHIHRVDRHVATGHLKSK